MRGRVSPSPLSSLNTTTTNTNTNANNNHSNVDMTAFAERLIRSVVRAFYTDECICIIDVLIRDKFLRDDDMGPRLKLSTKGLRKILQYLKSEQLVESEDVDDLNSGGSRSSTFWYIDYNHTIKVITLRIHLLLSSLEKAEQQARSSSLYVCPNYDKGLCNGSFTELQAQSSIDFTTGAFICSICKAENELNLEPEPIESYTLKVIDNTKLIADSMRVLKKVRVQLSEKVHPFSLGQKVIRGGILELLQLVRSSSRPLSSNLPSDNYATGIGSKRLVGTGRTATIKAKKAKLDSALGITSKDVASDEHGQNSNKGVDLLYLKNGRGEEFAFSES